MGEEKKEKTWSILAGLLLLPALYPWEGFVLKKLWGWFVAPLGVRAISISWAIGLACLIGLFTHQVNVAEKKSLGSLETIAVCALRFGIALLVGWIAMKVMAR